MQWNLQVGLKVTYYQYDCFVGTGFLNHEDGSLQFCNIFHRFNHKMVAWSHQVRNQCWGVSIDKNNCYQAPSVQQQTYWCSRINYFKMLCFILSLNENEKKTYEYIESEIKTGNSKSKRFFWKHFLLSDY